MRPAHCDRARQWASIRLDGGLSELESVLLDRHVAACADCASFLRTVTAQTELLRSAKLDPLPAPVPVPQRRTAGRTFAAAGLAAAAAAAVAVLGVGGPGNAPGSLAASASPVPLVAPAQPGSDTLGVARQASVHMPARDGGVVRGIVAVQT